jgi:hypothetical protein
MAKGGHVNSVPLQAFQHGLATLGHQLFLINLYRKNHGIGIYLRFWVGIF